MIITRLPWLGKQINGSKNHAKEKDEWMESLMKCDFFYGEWVKDDSYPLYEPGSCTLIDEQFNCIRNGRPDKSYQKYKWKPKGCNLPRNMWESLICILRNAVKDKRKVYEANGRVHFRGEASYSFIFKWEIPDKNGKKKETLRLIYVGRSSAQYKMQISLSSTQATGIRRAITTWSRWVDTNINPSKSMVLFRGYSASHFSGGQWNSGGQCDNETEPIDNEKYLTEYPPKMRISGRMVIPQLYRKEKLSPEERRSPLRFQDCSHWCLPGVPDTWNEILYAELLMREYRISIIRREHR
ncbi:PMR5 N-terminal domain [Sesbania bispinosa]|nr:PMR5 N-terminal domain [Sesbania bispinosa]